MPPNKIPTLARAAGRLPRPLTPQATGRWRPPTPASTSQSASFFSSTPAWHDRQVHPRGAYYDVLLSNPTPYTTVTSREPPSAKAATSPVPAPPAQTATTTPTTSPDEKAQLRKERLEKAQEQARIIFGSRLAGPKERAERLAAIRDRSQRIAGVLVPPKPEEPDNCCMSGCVDCVWDRFRDEVEAWAQANAEATRRLKAQEAGVAASVVAGASGTGSPPSLPTSATSGGSDGMSMDDDGGGSHTNWDLDPLPSPSSQDKDFFNDELYKTLPVGIREFMKQEKRLKLKHIQQGTLGG